MKVDLAERCVFCGAPVADNKHNEVLEIHRWCQTPQKKVRIDKTSIVLPTCTACYKKHHPLYKLELLLPLCTGIIAAVCVLYSLILKDIFSQYSFFGIIMTLLLCVGGAFLFTWLGYLFTTMCFSSAFKASVNVSPYSDLEAVKYMKSNGFIDEDDKEYIVVNTDSTDFVPMQTFRDELWNRFSCYKKL